MSSMTTFELISNQGPRSVFQQITPILIECLKTGRMNSVDSTTIYG